MPPCTLNKMAACWNAAIVPGRCTSRQRRDSSSSSGGGGGGGGEAGSHWTYCSLPAQPQNNRGDVQCLLSSVYWRFCGKKKKKKTTIWWQPDCLPIDAVLIFALGLLYVLKNDGRLDFEHTLTHTHKHAQAPPHTSPISLVCSYAVSHLSVFWELNQ